MAVRGQRRSLQQSAASTETTQRDLEHIGTETVAGAASSGCLAKASGSRESQRRVGHTHAEQKRRYNIKNGFDQLRDLIPQLQHSSTKVSESGKEILFSFNLIQFNFISFGVI